jgi:hypothetical protein
MIETRLLRSIPFTRSFFQQSIVIFNDAVVCGFATNERAAEKLCRNVIMLRNRNHTGTGCTEDGAGGRVFAGGYCFICDMICR